MPIKSLYIFISILLIIVSVRLYFFYTTKPLYKNGEYVSFKAQVLSEPKEYSSYQNFSVALPSGDIVFVKTNIYPEYNYGDKISVSGNLKIGLLNNKTQILKLNYPKIEAVKNNGTDMLAVVNYIRQKIINIFQRSLPKDSAGLLLGIVFGIKGDLSKDFLTGLKTAGVMHVIAASGMNVTMVGGFMFYIFGLFLRRQIAVVFSISAILFYAMLAGFEASIVRASIMGIIAFSAQALGRQQFGFYALLLTALLMLILWPKYLFDVGFQLSFFSTAGILSIPLVFKKRRNFLSEDLLTTVSAQIATLPILFTNFGTYSLWSVFVNVLVLWTVPVLMILGGLGAVISFIFEPLAKIFLYLSLPFLLYFEKIVGIFSNFKGNIALNEVPWQFGVSYYLFLAFILTFLAKRKNE